MHNICTTTSTIVGTGIDIIEIDRIAKIYNKHQNNFLQKVFHLQEIQAMETIKSAEVKVAYMAKRFAAKEAISKAMGVGFSGTGFSNIAILNDTQGKPYVKLHGKAKNTLSQISNNADILISMSDSRLYAIANALITIKNTSNKR